MELEEATKSFRPDFMTMLKLERVVCDSTQHPSIAGEQDLDLD